MRHPYASTVAAAVLCGALTACGDGGTTRGANSPSFPATRNYRKVVLEQSAAANPALRRAGEQDAFWWGLDLRRTPIERTTRLIDADGSHIDQAGVGIGRLPAPPGDATNIEVRAFGGCSPAFYVHYDARRTLLCNRDQRTAALAEAEFSRLAARIVRRFDLRPGTAPATASNGTRVLAVRFAKRLGTKRAWSPYLDQVVLARTDNRVLLAVSLKHDAKWTTSK